MAKTPHNPRRGKFSICLQLYTKPWKEFTRPPAAALLELDLDEGEVLGPGVDHVVLDPGGPEIGRPVP